MDALVIDDSRVMRTILTRILNGLGFTVAEAADGSEALSYLEDTATPSLALVDWNMPVMDGLAFVSAVRARPEWRDITLMMVTTESEHSQIVRALAAGAHEYVLKPFTPDAIREKLEMLGVVPEVAR